MFNKYEDELRKCASDWKIGVVNDHEIIALWNITDMDGLQTIMSSPEMTQWDADNNAVDVIYSIEKILGCASRGRATYSRIRCHFYKNWPFKNGQNAEISVEMRDRGARRAKTRAKNFDVISSSKKILAFGDVYTSSNRILLLVLFFPVTVADCIIVYSLRSLVSWGAQQDRWEIQSKPFFLENRGNPKLPP